MNVANITDSNATVMFSARLRNHRPTVMTREVIDLFSMETRVFKNRPVEIVNRPKVWGGPLRMPGRRLAAYWIALMRSSAPFGQSLPYLSTYLFCANVRKALWSGS